jgi:hypothetical protein
VARPYGKIRRQSRRTEQAPKDSAFKVKFRGKDGMPLSIGDLRQELYELVRRLQVHEETHRVKWATLFLTVIDQDGKEVLLDASGEWELRPYECAADEHDA